MADSATDLNASATGPADSLPPPMETEAGDAAQPGDAAAESGATVVSNGVAAPAAAAAAAQPAAVAAPADAAAAVAIPHRPFDNKWLLAADKNRQHFADELFNGIFSQENVEKTVQELKDITAAKIAKSHRLCDNDHTYMLQICTHGNLRTPVHLMRIELPYSVLADDSPVCIFVRDLKKPPATPGRNAKQANLADLTVKYYENLLTSAGVDVSNITVMPLSQLFNEHTSNDQRRKLTYLYDKFMVEASQATRVNAFLGAKLMFDSRAAFPLNLKADNLAAEYDVVLRQVFYQAQTNLPDYLYVRPQIAVGRESQDIATVAENIIDLLGQLGTLQPGGAWNVLMLNLRASGNVNTSVQLFKDPLTSAPVVPAPTDAADAAEQPAAAEPSETEKLLVRSPLVSQYIIDNSHYMVYDGEDDYAEEFGLDGWSGTQPHFAKGGPAGPQGGQQKRSAVAVRPEPGRAAKGTVAAAAGGRAGPAGVKQIAETIAAGNTASVDQLVLRGLRKLLGQQNLSGLMNGNQPYQQQQQQGSGGLRRNVNSGPTGGVVRRVPNQRGGHLGGNRPGGPPMMQQPGMQPQQQQRRRIPNQMNGNGPMGRNNNNNNRRF